MCFKIFINNFEKPSEFFDNWEILINAENFQFLHAKII